MKYLLTVLMFALSTLSYAEEEECRVYTEEQEQVLHLAYQYGKSEDLGLTLAAIVQQESFVGPYVVRHNIKDYSVDKKTGKIIRGSFGLTHILLETAMWLEGETNIWRAKDYIVTELVSNDVYALELAVKKLKSVQSKARSWKHLVSLYNGAGQTAKKYANDIVKHVNNFRKCDVVGKVLTNKEVEIHKFGVDDEEFIFSDNWIYRTECNKLWIKD